jgi:hypothetical protein
VEVNHEDIVLGKSFALVKSMIVKSPALNMTTVKVEMTFTVPVF